MPGNCPKCQAALSEGSAFCSQRGQRLADETHGAPAPRKGGLNSEIKGWHWVVASIIASVGLRAIIGTISEGSRRPAAGPAGRSLRRRLLSL
jgi:hypothetical protein